MPAGGHSKGSARAGERPVFAALHLPLALGGLALLLSGCMGSDMGRQIAKPAEEKAHINEETKFSAAEYGVAGSPRVTTEKRPRKGGGRYQVGKPYTIKGITYYPRVDPSLNETGIASWYGPNFHGRLTANGEIYDQYALTAAHPTMPLPSYARVTNLENGRAITVRVNDRGPFAPGRVIDLSARAAQMLGYDRKGLAKVRVQYAGEAPLHGLDESFLMASYEGPGTPRGVPGQTLPGMEGGTMIALADPAPVPSGSVALQPVAAIEAVAGPSQGSQGLLSGPRIPIPEERPTLFEGVPLQVAGEPVYRLSPVPLAFAGDAMPERLSAYLARAGTDSYLGETPDAPVTIELGVFEDGTDVARLAMVLAEAGGSLRDGSSDEESRRYLLVIREDRANSVLGWLRSQGLASARIL